MRVKTWHHTAYEQGSSFRASQIIHFIVIHMFFWFTDNTAISAWKYIVWFWAEAQPWWLHERFVEWGNCGLARLLVATSAVQAGFGSFGEFLLPSFWFGFWTQRQTQTRCLTRQASIPFTRSSTSAFWDLRRCSWRLCVELGDFELSDFLDFWVIFWRIDLPSFHNCPTNKHIEHITVAVDFLPRKSTLLLPPCDGATECSTFRLPSIEHTALETVST